jgi:branched-chain amino acid aminotransferase
MSPNPVWVNGALSGTIDPRDRGLTLGDGVFDTLVAFRQVPFAGDRHLARLVGHAAAIGISVDPEAVRAGWQAVLGAAQYEQVVLRTSVTRGAAGRRLWPASALKPTIVVSASPWTPDLAAKPLTLATSTIRRNETSPLSRLKSLNYLDNILAAREAVERAADDSLFLNSAGRVASTTIANVFALSGRRLTTPPASEGVMSGIVRGLVLELAPMLGLEPAEAPLTLEDLRAADTAFLTNSVRLVSPVMALDGHPRGAQYDLIHKLNTALGKRIARECGHSLCFGG